MHIDAQVTSFPFSLFKLLLLRVQSSGGKLWTSYRLRQSRFKSPLRVPVDYVIHGSGGWGRASVVYSLGLGTKGPALVRFRVIQKNCLFLKLKCISKHVQF